MKRSIHNFLLPLMLGMAPVRVVVAQTPTLAQQPATVLPEHQFEGRAQLEAAAQVAESQHRTQEAWMLRTRLKNGDFQEGDRILISFQSQATPADTFIVRAGKVLQLPGGLNDIQLDGVLRSELTLKLTTHLAKYLVDPTVRATPLVRIGVLGQVGRQGYFYTSADVVLSDLLMRAGGPTPAADLDKMVIRRGRDIIWTGADTRTALSDGLTLDRLNLRANDEIEIGERKQFSWLSLLPAASGVLAVAVTVIQLTRHK